MSSATRSEADVHFWWQDMETIRILNEQYEKESKKANIPVPPITIVEDYDKHVAKDFTRPQSYLRFKGMFAALSGN